MLHNLDGSHTRADLLDMLAELVSERKLTLNEDAENLQDGISIREALAKVLDGITWCL